MVPLRNMGAALSPFNAFLILQGIETLALRMDRICDNALKVAGFLKESAAVEWVEYAGLPDHPASRWPTAIWAAAPPASCLSASRAAPKPAAASSTRCGW
ncbi:Cystathionine beta-lyase [Chromobacterium violaceum]|uniref:Cystathionine beta-lyase n=1 Tax=Chromobacterium violaceum TaxID=536 RepID=A0A3S4HHT6_CHRVL|nr:Cystathionine beta-lyase [Chromobacterium violaceum]